MSWFSMRSNQMLLFFMALMAILGIRLFFLTGIQHDKWAEAADSNIIRSIVTNAPRGEVFDRNGILIAGNRATFAVAFAKNEMGNKELNDSIQNLLAILDANGEKTADNLPVKMTSSGKFYYSYQTEIQDWLKSHNFPSNFTAAQAFDELRRQNNIDPGLDVYEAQSRLMDTYGVYPPISIKTFEFTYEQDKRNFLKMYNINNEKMSAEGAFNKIRTDMEIDKSLSQEEARRIMAIRYELSAQGAYKYIPVKIATGLKKETVIKLQENLQDLSGVSVYTDSVRYYPQGTTASHVIGYLGRMSQDRWDEKYKDIPGYNRSDMIGLDGIEQSQETNLKGEDGEKRVQVNALGETMAVIGKEKKAEKGKDMALTIDMRLQEVAEDALERDLKAVRAGGTFASKYGNYRVTQAAPHAEVGAAVVLNVKTGEPLAIANFPNFDPNDFTEGISREVWNKYQGTNPRDPLSPRPLYNVAVMTAVQPGSTFKPMTAITALESGLDPNRNLYDAGHIVYGGTSYGCMLWNTTKGHSTHGAVNLYTATQVSCNYYFYDIGTGIDWANGQKSLGYKMSVEKIMGYARQFGLGVESGIEINETTVSAPSAEKKLRTTQSMLKNYLIGQAEYVFENEVLKNNDLLMKNIDTITGWVSENPDKVEIENRLLKLGVKPKESANLAEQIKYNYFSLAEWGIGDMFNISIGQGENAYTPLQLARFIATIGNNGELNKLSIIKAVEGKGEIPRVPAVKADVEEAYLKDVIAGMRRVVTGGTLNNLTELKVSVVGKSGTAQRSGRINPPDEIAYIKEHLSGINPKLTWPRVQNEMNRLMKEYPDIYDNPNTAVRKAVMNLSGRNFKSDRLDVYKSKYDDFAWVMAMAPADDPEIAVVCLIVQGGASRNAIPVVKELIGKYFDLKAEDEKNNRSIDYVKFFSGDKSKSRITLDYLHKGTPDMGTQSAITSGGGLADGLDDAGDDSGTGPAVGSGGANVGDNVGADAID